MSRRHRPAGGRPDADGPTPYQLVRELEASIAARRAAAESARDEVAQAYAQAEVLLAEAEVQAADAGRRHAAVILAAAQAEAVRLADDGARAAAGLIAAAERRRDADIATVLALVVPGRR